jgi:hypothetical protein
VPTRRRAGVNSRRPGPEWELAPVSPGLEVSVGLDLTEPMRGAILKPPADSCGPTIIKGLGEAEVAEITSPLDPTTWLEI